MKTPTGLSTLVLALLIGGTVTFGKPVEVQAQHNCISVCHHTCDFFLAIVTDGYPPNDSQNPITSATGSSVLAAGGCKATRRKPRH